MSQTGPTPRSSTTTYLPPNTWPLISTTTHSASQVVRTAYWLGERVRPTGLIQRIQQHAEHVRHRIDSVTVYCTPATGPHGFHTLGRTVESTLRSFNNLLERLHASYFFYLVPMPHHFIPVGHYLPAAVLLGASLTIGGFDCPAPLEGVMWMLPAFLIGWVGWVLQTPLVCFLGLALPRPGGEARRSVISLCHLLYGALVPTLAMVNFPQALLLGSISVLYLMPPRWARLGLLGLAHPWWATRLDLRWEWETIGNLAWPGVFAIWVPLWVLSSAL